MMSIQDMTARTLFLFLIFKSLAMYCFPKLDPEIYPVEDDEKLMLDLLKAEKVLLVQGTGFNWPTPDHFRVVFLPAENELREAINRLSRFLAKMR
jgi:alanine-synthesizing transaminase